MARITHAHLSQLFYRLEKAYTAGLDLRSLLQRESQTAPPNVRSALSAIAQQLQQGSSLAESMAQQDDLFPPLAIAVVTVGERGGRLEESFARLSRHYANLVDFRKKLWANLAWPIFELSMAIVIVGALILILGFILEGNEDFQIDWFGMGLGTIGNFTLYCTLVLGALSGIGLLVWGTVQGWFGTLPWRLARYIPLVGRTIECLSLSRFAWTVSVAENAGMMPQETVRLALAATQNFFYTRLWEPLREALDRRRELSVALRDTGEFPEDFIVNVETGEIAGQLAETMDRTSHQLQETAEQNLKTLATVGFVLTFLLIAAIIGTTVVVLFKKIYLDPISNFKF